ncbi:hypothetical protein M0P98_04985 [bacterium]|nr:hypothetical protein [bacterium]
MKRIVLVVMFLFSALLIYPLLAYDFSADTVIKDKNTTVNGKIFVSGEKTRMEMPEMALISRVDKRVEWKLVPKQKVYTEQLISIKMVVSEKFPDEVERKLVGQENIDGHIADKYLITLKSDETTEQIYQWISRSTKFPLKTANMDDSWSIEFNNIKRGRQNYKLFEVPAGYTKIDLSGKKALTVDKSEIKNGIKVGWAQTNITPKKKVYIAGQFHARISEGVMDPVTATVLVIESDNNKPNNYAIMISCDLVGVSNELIAKVKEKVRLKIPELDPDYIFLGATHTHAAPLVKLISYGLDDFPEVKDVMPPTEYLEFASERISGTVVEAWKKREYSGISYGMGHAVVGRNRRLKYKNGKSRMYGRAHLDTFSHVEGFEDHSVYAMMTYNTNNKLTGIVINIACPSQVSEGSYKISADFWHDTREEIRKRFGEDVYILPQCAPAGDISPRVLIGNRAESRMRRLKGRSIRLEIAERITNAIDDIVPFAEKEIEWQPEFQHRQEIIELPRRLIAEESMARNTREINARKKAYSKLLEEYKSNPEMRKKTRWYSKLSSTYRLVKRGETLQRRFELQKTSPNLPTLVHIIRIGDTVFATNPFELYLDFGIQIQEWSKATQTFLIQKAGCDGTYLPTQRSVEGGGYGSVPASTDIGPEGGDILVNWTVSAINEMFK